MNTTVNIHYDHIDKKYTVDGKSAIALTRSYGIYIDDIRCDPIFIDLLLKRKEYKHTKGDDKIKIERKKYNDDVDAYNKIIDDEINKHVMCNFPLQFPREKYWINSVIIKWVPVGTFFKIKNCGDNGESLVTIQLDHWQMI